jgi:hypothetical protein
MLARCTWQSARGDRRAPRIYPSFKLIYAMYEAKSAFFDARNCSDLNRGFVIHRHLYLRFVGRPWSSIET